MPTVLDATVVNSAYDTSGNGGRKLVRLGDGTLWASLKNGGTVVLRKSTNNGSTWADVLITSTFTTIYDHTIVTNGTNVYLIVNLYNGAAYHTAIWTLKLDGTVLTSGASIDTGQSALGNVSITINESGTELHATWSSKNATYPNSFNTRYAKGTINADGSVTWGAPEQRTTINASGSDFKNPTIVCHGSKVTIIAETSGGGNYSLVSWTYNGTTWGGQVSVIPTTTYAQSSPSAIFVPQSVNGLANGRIWVAWHGKDATDTTYDNIRVSYSDDGGVTWSAMQKLTSGNLYQQLNATITANKIGEVFVLWSGADAVDINHDIRQIKFSGSSWGTIQIKATGTTNAKVNPSALYDLSVNFTEPLFVYKDAQNAKVGFYGTWTVTTISVTQGSIGQKTDKANLLTYTITTDGNMSTITEKVNGVTIGTKTATSGQSLIAGLTQEQWDAVRFGKYADATGGQNTLTVEMGGEKWTYTFDKRPATDSDIISAVKAVKDSQEVYIPSVKAKLASAVRSKGGSANDADSFEVLASAVKEIALGSKKATGTATFNGSGQLTISNLTFSPKIVYIYTSDKAKYGFLSSDVVSTTLLFMSSSTTGTSGGQSILSNGFSLTSTQFNNATVTWVAYGEV